MMKKLIVIIAMTFLILPFVSSSFAPSPTGCGSRCISEFSSTISNTPSPPPLPTPQKIQINPLENVEPPSTSNELTHYDEGEILGKGKKLLNGIEKIDAEAKYLEKGEIKQIPESKPENYLESETIDKTIQDWTNKISNDMKSEIVKEARKSQDKIDKLTKDLSAEQLSQTKELRELIMDSGDSKFWDSIVENNKGVEVLREMGFNVSDNSNLIGSKWSKIGSEAFLQSKNGTKVPMTKVKGTELEFTNDGGLKANLLNENGEIAGSMEVTEGFEYGQLTTESAQALGDPFADPQGRPSGGGGGGGGSWEEKFVGAIQQAVSFASQIMSGLKESLKGNGKGDSKTKPNSLGGTDTEMIAEAGIKSKREGDEEEISAKPNDESLVGIFSTTSNPEITKGDGIDIVVPKQAAAETPPGVKTEIQTAGIDGNSQTHPVETDTEPTPLPSPTKATTLTTPLINKIFNYIIPITVPTVYLNEPSITGQAIIDGKQVNLGQYIRLKDHDLEISGRDLTVYALKTFNDVEAGGQEINVLSGQIEIKFNGQKLLYPRLVKNAPYGFKKVSNKLDRENDFKLQHYTDRSSLLTDYRGIASIGDIFTLHPRNPGLVISKIRLPMWKTN
tara:strand:+ start:776 stop:2629 length:1854 start_codon:yes stop_codon:yes gene_type:complete